MRMVRWLALAAALAVPFGTAAAQVSSSPACDRLHLAALDGPAAIVATLAGGVDLECRDEYGYTALHVVAAAGRADAVAALLAHGADAGARDDRGLTPLALSLATRRIAGAEEAVAYDRIAALLRAAGRAP